MALEPRIEAVRAKYDLATDDFWQIKQNKQWVCKHAALEIVAVKAGIEWLPPQIIEADAPNLVTSMIVTGKMGNRTEWATGETNKTNYSVQGKQPAYPWAMTEKRAKDRVVLKLVGIHGLVYSEDEADDFKNSNPQQPSAQDVGASSPVATPQTYTALEKSMRENKTVRDLAAWWKDTDCVTRRKTMTEDWQRVLHDNFTKYGFELKGKEAKPDQTVSDIQDTFPGSNVVDDRMHPLNAG